MRGHASSENAAGWRPLPGVGTSPEYRTLDVSPSATVTLRVLATGVPVPTWSDTVTSTRTFASWPCGRAGIRAAGAGCPGAGAGCAGAAAGAGEAGRAAGVCAVLGAAGAFGIVATAGAGVPGAGWVGSPPRWGSGAGAVDCAGPALVSDRGKATSAAHARDVIERCMCIPPVVPAAVPVRVVAIRLCRAAPRRVGR